MDSLSLKNLFLDVSLADRKRTRFLFFLAVWRGSLVRFWTSKKHVACKNAIVIFGAYVSYMVLYNGDVFKKIETCCGANFVLHFRVHPGDLSQKRSSDLLIARWIGNGQVVLDYLR